MKRFTFSVPQNILFGEGVLKELPGAAGKLGGKHGFIISGPTLNRLGVVGQCEEILTQAGIAVSTFCDTEGNPSVETVERAAEAFRDKRGGLYCCSWRRFSYGCGKSRRRCGEIRRQHHRI